MLYVRKLTRDGFTLASVQYRLSGTGQVPGADRSTPRRPALAGPTGGRYGFDRQHGLSGASAGGHLASLLGVKTGQPEIKAVCVLYPATDLTGFPNQNKRHGYLPDLLGGTVNEKRALAEEGSTTNHVRENAPPFLIFHGDKDTLVPLVQSQELKTKLHAADCRGSPDRPARAGARLCL